MGIQNRDYYRSDAAGGGWSGSYGQSMCQILIIVTAVVYLLQFLITVPQRVIVDGEVIAHAPVIYVSLLEEWFDLDPVKVSQGQVWRLLTYAFLHSRHSQMHIIFNMLALWMFGSAIEQLLRKREFLAFYLVSAIASGLVNVLYEFAMGDPSPALGASGAVMAVSTLFAIYYPTAPINIYIFFTIEARWLIILYLFWDSLPILKAISGMAQDYDHVAHAAHLGGLVFGLLYYQLHWRLSDWYPKRGGQTIGQRLTRWWTRPRLRVYQTPVERPVARSAPPVSPRELERLERRVDEILKKIKEQGEASLSDEERSLLRDASQAYKKRNT